MIRPYPEYRDSGDEWLGALPSHWAVRRLKQVAHAYPSNVDKKSHEGELPVRLCNYTDVYYNDVIADVDGLMVATASADQVEKFSLRAGDVIITKDSETADDIAVSAYVPDDLPGVVCGYYLSMIRPKAGTSGAFLKRYFDSHYAKSSVAVRANGLTRVGLGQYAVDNLLVPVPPLEEQTAIAGFLDREIGKIDALVEAQRRLIDLMKEKRQAVVSHVVSKGLDRTAPMKDSGVEWLGEVPAHWRVCLLKRAFARTDYGISESLEPEGPIGVLRMGNIQEGRITVGDLKYVGQVDDALLLRPGDLLFNRTNSLDQIGKVGMVRKLPDAPLTFASYLVRLQLADQGVPEFMSHMLNTRGVLDQARARALVAIGQCNLNPVRYGEIVIALPPAQEQRFIAIELDRLTAQIDALVREAMVVIARLTERRAALISAAVTGKFDIRPQRQAPVAADQATARRLVGATVLELVADTPASGRMTSAKRMYLAEAHAGVWELQGQPQRMAAGPFDGALMSEVEAELARVGHIATSQPGGPNSQVHYRLTGARGALRAELDALLGDRRAAFDKMLADLGGLESKGVEAVATLYAVWNDMLIDGKTPTDDVVIDGALNDWHAEKRDKFTRPELHNYLGWMRRHDLTPSGRGPRTKSGALL